jgi:WD40 repeat protein
MLARLTVVLGIAELAAATPARRLPAELVRELSGRIEEPTLGAWHAMAVVVARHVAELQTKHFPELPALVESLGSLLTGGLGRADRHEENALIAVRNAFAHGGGVSEARAAALLKRWQPDLDSLVSAATWLGEIELLVRRPNGGVARVTGADCDLQPIEPPTDMPQTAGAAAIYRSGKMLPLEPLVIFGVPTLHPGEEPLESEPAVQAYARRGPVRLLLTPFGSESVIQSVGSEALTQAFQELFDFSAAERAARERRFIVPGFEADIRKEAARVIGRAEEGDRLWEATAETREGALWIGGPAGVGKSALMARLAQQLLEEASERESRADQQKWLVLPYRFRAGDGRCRSDRFIAYLLERLEAWDSSYPETAERNQERRGRIPLQQIGMLLAHVGPHRVIILADGLDEIDRIDPDVVDTVLPQIRGAGVLLICAGRPEPRLLGFRDRLQAQEPLPDGVPRVTDGDIRAQLLARIDRASRLLIQQDRDWAGGSTRNLFIEQVVANADGLPLYVELVANDIIELRLRVLDAIEARQLPKGLNAYFEALIDRHSLDDTSVIRALAAAALTLAREPLSAGALAALVRRQGYEIDADSGASQVETVLASISALILPAETPERTSGYRLYHDALRTHLDSSQRFTKTLATMRRVFSEGALHPAGDEATRYLYRNGVSHLVAAGRADAARMLLADFDYLMDRLMMLAEADPLPAVGITDDWNAVVKVVGRGDGDARRAEAFWRERAQFFYRGNLDWPSYKILLQIAVEHGDDSPMSRKADAWIASGRCDWPWLRRLSRPARTTQSEGVRLLEAERKQIVFGALLLPDARILSWWSDYNLRCFDSETGAVCAVLSGHNNFISGVLVMPDGHLLSWSSDGTLRLWDSATGVPGPVLSGHAGRVVGALVISDGRILSWSDDMTLRLWDARTGEPGPVLSGHTDGVEGALVMPDGRILSWSEDMTLRLWDGLTGEPGPLLSGHIDGVEGALVMPDGRILSWTGKAGTKLGGEAILRLWDGLTGKPGPVLSRHVDTVFGALVMPDGHILSWSNDTTLRLWDPTSGAPGRYSPQKPRQGVSRLRSWLQGFFEAPASVLSGHTAGIFGALVTPDGRILSWSWDTTLRLWDGRTGEPGPVLAGHTKMVTGALVMPDGRILSWSQDNTVRLWDGTTGEPGPMDIVVKPPVGSSGVDGALAMPDGRVLSWFGDTSLRLWDPGANQTSSPLSPDDQISELRKGHVGTAAIPFSDDAQIFELSDEWKTKQDEIEAQIDEFQVQIDEWETREVLVLPDGRFGFSRRGSLELYDGAHQKPDLVLTGHTGTVNGVLATPDGRLLTWSSDKTLRLWDGRTGEPGPVLSGHTDGVEGALVMPDGRILSWSEDNTLSWSEDNTPSWSEDNTCTLRLWDGRTGAPGPAIAWPAGVEGALAIPDGRILTWSADCALQLWNGETLQPGPALPVSEDSIPTGDGPLVMPDGRILRWLGGEIRIWNGTAEDRGLVLSRAFINGALLMSDGRILSWSDGTTLRMWNATTGQAGPVLRGHTKEVVGALVVPDGRILSWSQDETLRLWDDTTGAPGPVFSGCTHYVMEAFIMPDGRILSLSWDGTVRLWRLPVPSEPWDVAEVFPEVVIAWQGAERLWSGPVTVSGLVAGTGTAPTFLHRGADRVAFTDLP